MSAQGTSEPTGSSQPVPADGERQANDTIQPAGKGMKRRGILAAAGAVVAAVMAKQAARPVAAVTGAGDGGALVNGANDIFGTLPRSKNTAANPTQLTNTSGTVTASPTSFFHQGAGLIVTASDGAEGIMGFANGPFGVGVWGVSNRGRAVYGELTGSGAADGGKAVSGDAGSNTNAYGVYGSASSASSTGVYGLGSQGIGVHGESTSGIGVQGQITSGTAANTVAVQGLNQSTGSGGFGVHGFCANGIGVWGQSEAPGSYGVLGTTDQPSSIAIAGSTTADGASAFSGGTTNPLAYAAYFQGHVVVAGSFDVSPLGNKHGVAEHPDGTQRTFYSVESPECWVEDFGEGTLVNGSASVALDPDFAALVHTDKYHVFVTEHDENNALHVTKRRAAGFTVQADNATMKAKGKSAEAINGTFSYRVVAKPKTTATVERLAKVTLPNLPLPSMPKAEPPQPIKEP